MMESSFEILEEDLMAKSDRLIEQFQKALGKYRVNSDWLSQYRIWLDDRKIRSEVDGWPSPEAFSQINIRNFIDEILAARGRG